MHSSQQSTAFLNIIEENKGIIYKIANSYCLDSEDRNDLIQEIMIQLWLAFGKYDSRFRISTWMYRIALNVAISFYRKEHRRYQLNQPLSDNLLYLRESPAPDDEELLNSMHRFIRELKEIDRAIILLYLDGNPQQDIAEVLGISVSNVSTRVGRIKQQLRQKLSTLKP